MSDLEDLRSWPSMVLFSLGQVIDHELRLRHDELQHRRVAEGRANILKGHERSFREGLAKWEAGLTEPE